MAGVLDNHDADSLIQAPTSSGPSLHLVTPQRKLRKFDDPIATRDLIYSNVLDEARKLEPVSNKVHTLKISDIDYEDPDTVPLVEHKKAILEGRTLSRRLRGTLHLIDNATGDTLDSQRLTLAAVPHMTNHGTFVMNGSEYTLANQARLRSGSFTRMKDNGELENHINILPGKGITHRVHMDPETGVFRLNLNQGKIPLMPILKAMGMTDSQLRHEWGNDIFAANSRNDKPQHVDKLHAKLVRDGSASSSLPKSQQVAEALNKMELDPEVTKRTLGQAFTHLTPEAYMAITKKLVAVNKGEAEPDDRDAMAYQTLFGPEDLFAERMRVANRILRPVLWKASFKKHLQNVQPGVLTKSIQAALTGSGLGQSVEEVNPSDLLDQRTRITRMGQGGIPSADSVPDDSRSVQPSHFGFIDSLRTPESMSVGVDTRLASAARKGNDGRVYTPFLDVRTGKTDYKSPQDLADSVIAFPGEMRADKKFVAALDKGKIKFVPREAVDYALPEMEHSFNHLSNMIPGKSTIKGQRVAMGSRMLTQALELVGAEAPFVRSGTPEDANVSYEELYGKHMGAVHAEQDGKVVSTTPDEIKVLHNDGSVKKHELYNNFPFNRKSFFHNTSMVQPGQAVKGGDLLAKSNFTDDKGVTALGLNLKTAYLPYLGHNYEDAYALSRSAAKRLSSSHMYQHDTEWTDDMRHGKQPYMGLFASRFNRKQVDSMDDDGVVKPGTVVSHSDPLVLMASERQRAHNQLSRSKDSSFKDDTLTWDHHSPGVVTDVAKTKKGVVVTVKSIHELKEGDKIAGRFGDKGVVSKIVEDDQMPHDKDGKPFEMLANPLGVITRTNVGQVFEAVLGKIAAVTGKPYRIQDFKNIPDMVKYAEDELAKHHMSDTEDVVDPTTGKKIKSVLTGHRFFMKLQHEAESKGQGRSTGSYTSEEIPAKGGETGSKRVSIMSLNALLSHGAMGAIRDASAYRGQKNQDLLAAFMQGKTTPEPRVPFVHHKFFETLRASGIHPVRQGGQIQIMAMTNKDVKEMAGDRELENAETVDWKDGLRPIKGGLFDPSLTGGHGGCFHSTVQVWTESGMMRIGDIVNKKLKVRVWSYNFEASKFELKPISGWFKNYSPSGIGRSEFFFPGRLSDRLPRFDPTTLWGTRGHQIYRRDGTKQDLATASSLVMAVETLSYSQTQLLYGGLLGDFHVGPGAFLSLSHCDKQRPYLDYKAAVLGGLASSITRYVDKSGGCVRWKNRLHSRAHAAFRQAREECYRDGVKTVTREWLDKVDILGLAFWIMDDGSTHRGKDKNTLTISIATHSFSKKEIEIIRLWLREKWAVRSSVTREHKKYGGRDCGWSIIATGRAADRLADLVSAYVPDCMRYKLGVEPKSGRCRRCERRIRPRRRICNKCALEEARLCGHSKLPKHVRRLFGGTHPLRYLIAVGAVPADLHPDLDRWKERMKKAGSQVETVKKDCLTSLSLTDVPCQFLWQTGAHYEKTRAVYDIEVSGNHNYFANGVLVSNSRWAKVTLHEPIPNPVMEDPIRKVLGLTEKRFEGVLAGREDLNGYKGHDALAKALDRINLPREISQARTEVKNSRATARDAAVKRLRILKHSEILGIHPRDWMLDSVPVLPPMFRPVSVMAGNNRPMVADANMLYKELIDANANLKDMKGQVDDIGDERLAVYHAFKGVTGLGDPIHPKNQEKKVKGLLQGIFGTSPKFGMVQRKLLGSTVDMVGRAVITPNPDLDMDQVGIPENRAWEIYKPFIVRNLARNGVNPIDAARMASGRTPQARKAMVDEMDRRPVILDRAPVLHRYGVMAFWPRLVKGETLQIPPTIVKGFGADFDGDTMSYHVPFSDDAVKDAIEKMLPSKNLISAGTMKVHQIPQNEYLGGLYTATSKKAHDRPEQVFHTKADALRALESGRISHDTRIVILDH